MDESRAKLQPQMEIYLNHNPETLQNSDTGNICKDIMIDKCALRNDLCLSRMDRRMDDKPWYRFPEGSLSCITAADNLKLSFDFVFFFTSGFAVLNVKCVISVPPVYNYTTFQKYCLFCKMTFNVFPYSK